MNDRFQSRAVRFQSSAIVIAAVITTSGAVIAACIQAGWIGKPPSNAVASLSNTEAGKQAYFTGVIEPISDTIQQRQPPIATPIGGAKTASYLLDAPADPRQTAAPSGSAKNVTSTGEQRAVLSNSSLWRPDWSTLPRKLQGGK